MARILLVGPDAEAARYRQAHLAVEGHEVAHVATAAAALDRVLRPAAAGEAPHLAAVTLGLPDRHGYEVVRVLRAEAPRVAVLALTECADEAHRVRGLRLGADDVLVEPFGITEFVARVEAVLRRTLANEPPAPASRAGVRFGDVEVDLAARLVRRRGAEVPLGPKEFDLLAALLGRPGAVASRAALPREVGGYDRALTSRTVDAHVAAPRRHR